MFEKPSFSNLAVLSLPFVNLSFHSIFSNLSILADFDRIECWFLINKYYQRAQLAWYQFSEICWNLLCGPVYNQFSQLSPMWLRKNIYSSIVMQLLLNIHGKLVPGHPHVYQNPCLLQSRIQPYRAHIYKKSAIGLLKFHILWTLHF